MNSVKTIKDELRVITVLPGIIVALLLSALPYIVGWLLTPASKVFTGALVNPDDVSVYLSAMRQGQAGGWLFHFTFSPEPLPPRLTYLLYFLFGRLTWLAGGSFILWFHVLRIAMSAVTLVSLVFWVRQALRGSARQQLTAWLLIVFGSGVGWLLIFFATLDPLSSFLAPDLRTPEWTVLSASLSAPHFVLGLGLEALLFGFLLRMAQGVAELKWAILGALAALGVGLVYPYNISIVGLVIGFYMLALAWQARGIPWRTWAHGAIVIAPLLPLLYYYGVWSRRDPFWELTHVVGNVIPPPWPLGVVVGFGLLGLLAVAGGWRWVQREKNWLVPTWALVNLLALYLPVPFSGRFALGLIVPVATLAAYGLLQVVLPWLKQTAFFTRFAGLTPTPEASLYRIILLLTFPSTLLLALVLVSNTQAEQGHPYYLPAGEWQAANWLAENSGQDDLVLVYYPMGNQLPGIIQGKVFTGQLFLTVRLDEKLAMLAEFWHEDTSPEWRDDFLREWGITHIYQGYYEDMITTGTVTPPGIVVYQAAGVTIYEVRGL